MIGIYKITSPSGKIPNKSNLEYWSKIFIE